MRLQAIVHFDLKRIDGVQKNLSRLQTLREAVGEYAAMSVNLNFEAEGRPNRWVDLKPKTWMRRAKMNKGNMILHDSGLLKKGIGSEVDGEDIWVSPSGPGATYAATHQFGDPDRNIPARPFLLLQETDIAYIRDFLRNEIMGGDQWTY